MVFKKGQKKPVKKKVDVVEEVKIEEEVVEEKPEVIEEENTGTTVVEKAITAVKNAVSRKPKEEVIGSIGNSPVTKPIGRIRFEAQVAPFPLFKLPDDLRRWIVNNGYTTDVYKKDKEWMGKHHVDMEMVEKLKAFLTEKL